MIIELSRIKKWIIFEFNNWHLNEDAPKEAVMIFNKYVKEKEDANKQGTIID